MNNPLVSVIVPVYNQEPWLPQCLESICAQTYRDLEIILVDDGSTDGSGRICDEYAVRDSRARVIHQENLDLCAARNRGQAESHGEYLAFVDGDDYIHKDFIRLLVEAVRWGGREHTMAVCGLKRTERSDEDTSSERHPSFTVMSQAEMLGTLLDTHSFGDSLWGSNCNKIYRSASLPVPFLHDYPRSQDFDANLRLAYVASDAAVIDTDLYYWLVHPGERSRSADDAYVRRESHVRMFYDNLSEIPAALKAGYRHRLLMGLYSRMVVFRKATKGTAYERQAVAEIRGYERKTLRQFLFCRGESLTEKLYVLATLHFSGLSESAVMKKVMDSPLFARMTPRLRKLVSWW